MRKLKSRSKKEKFLRITNKIKARAYKIPQKIVAALLLFLFNFQLVAANGIVPDPISIGTRARQTASGVPQVDIAHPNEKGVSYNTYEEFQVDEKGLVLNNNIYIVVDTEIAGLVARNRNLDGGVEAGLIINDVTGKNKTNINGYIEVAGKKADVVIANRNGIAVNGGGFINVGRATLTTGALHMKDGELDSIDVERGHIAIGSKGLDATRVNFLDMIGKTINVDGIIKGGENTQLLISAGGQVYKYKAKTVTSKNQTYQGVAIDGKAVGSMYAGKIDIISNDKGAGVNLKGDLVSLDDVNITSGGKIVTSGKVQAKKRVRYKAKQQVIVKNEVFAGEKGVFSGDTVTLDATLVTGYLNEARGITALEVTGKKIENSGDIQAFGVARLNSE
ncbi:filamentous hemagglutinin N-terminal domain-containing protein [Fusobacterium sp. PH5-44]|uniref:filamentous hemagglutinin N-terminal domain-containing protein n=1 Tax=Fusobacterium sp. PH5-44 TaxID=2940518 RepID=UPI003D1E2DAB